MKKILLLFFIFSPIFVIEAQQVGINTQEPHSSSVLDIESTTKGVLLPRMTTVEKLKIVNPAPGLLVYDTDLKCISQNIGTLSYPQWACLSEKSNQSSFFYMPSIAIDASTTGTKDPLDLYAEYKKQFETPSAKSENAPDSIPYFPQASDLYYYITYYDENVLEIKSLSDTGKLYYNIKKEAEFSTFMNIVFVVK